VTHQHTVTVSYVGNHGATYAQVGTFTATETQDTFGTGTGGTVDWNFAVADSALQALAGGETVVQTYQVTISDGLGDVTTQNVDITLNGVNDAPVLTPSNPNLAAIAATQGTLPGQTVASILGASVSDVDDGAQQGIAITGATNAHGSWQYSTDGGAHWTNFAAYSAGSALLLAGTDLVRFHPDGSGYGSSDTFSYVAWDQTTGTDATTASTLVSGGTTAFSVASDTAHLTVTGLDQPPVITSAPENVVVTENASYQAPVNLVQNGGFEASPNYSGWTVTKTLPSDTTSTYTGHNGGAGALIQTGGNGNDVVNFSQSFATTAGVTYAISFWVSNAYYYSGGNFIDVVWNGSTVLAEINIPSTGGYGNFVEFTVNVTGTGTTSTLDLALHNPDDFVLDDVSMVPVITPGTETTGGLITFTDADVTDTHTVTVTPLGSNYLGTFTPVKTEANGSGSITWTYTVADSAIAFLGAGQTEVQTYRVTVDDGRGGSTYQDETVTLTGVNDAPVLTVSHPSLPTLIAGPGQAAGETVATLLGGSVSDADTGAVQGIAITGSTGSHGSWQYSTDGGAHWTSFATYSAGSALLLAATDMVRFQPDGTTYGSTDTFSYVAWDQTSGTHATTASTLVNGGSSAFSSASDTATETVTAVDQPPVITSAPESVVVTQNASYQTPASLVTNGGFESNSFTGWTLAKPAGDFAGINNYSHSGNYGALIQTTGSSSSDIVQLSQSLATTAGATYAITFWVSNAYFFSGNFVDVLWNGSTVLAENNIAATGSLTAFNEYTVNVVATGATSAFEIDLHNSDDFVLDDVSVQAVATPGTESSSGKITFTDADVTDTHTITVTPQGSGYLGSFTPVKTEANGSGSITWTYTVADSVIAFLGAGQTEVQTYRVTVDDGHGGSTFQDVNVTLTGVNDAPVLTVSHPSLPTLIAGPGQAAGETVATLLGGHVSDADTGALQGIAITGSHGSWQYSTDSGAHWSNFATYSAGSALLLAATDMVRFQPDGTSNGSTDTFSYVAWDQTSGAHATTASTLVSGGTSAFSIASDTATETITAGGDQPPVNAPGPQVGTVTEGFSFTVPTGELVSNGGFESALSPAWTVVDQTGDQAGQNGNHHSGNDAGGFRTASTSPGDVVKLSQPINTVAGVSYTLSFWVLSSSPVPSGSTSFIHVLWDGTTDLTLNNMSTGGGFVEYSFNVIGTGHDTLEFDMQDYFTTISLDDVSVMANITPGIETTNGTITFTDADAGDTHTVSVAANNNIGTFTAGLGTESSNNSTGTVNWAFSATDAQIAALVGAQQSTTETYTVTINDGHGGVASQNVTVNIINPDHAPQITPGAQTGSVTEGFSYALNTTQLVADGGFEAGTNNGLGNSWTATIHGSFGDVLEDLAFPAAQAGSQSLLLWTGSDAANDVIKLTQSVANTVAGDPYTLTFFAANGNGFDPGNFIHVLWNNQTVLSLSAIPASDFNNFVEYSATLVGTGTTSTLEFDF
jgi:VCBS repeat-containing protein